MPARRSVNFHAREPFYHDAFVCTGVEFHVQNLVFLTFPPLRISQQDFLPLLSLRVLFPIGTTC
jgi:hypothetical protein